MDISPETLELLKQIIATLVTVVTILTGYHQASKKFKIESDTTIAEAMVDDLMARVKILEDRVDSWQKKANDLEISLNDERNNNDSLEKTIAELRICHNENLVKIQNLTEEVERLTRRNANMERILIASRQFLTKTLPEVLNGHSIDPELIKKRVEEIEAALGEIA